MTRDTLLDFFHDRIRSSDDFLVYTDSYRSYRYRYDDIAAAARRFAGRLADAGVEPGQAVVIWGENRPEWIVALWGCWLARAVVVPIDFRASADYLARVVRIVDARLVLLGRDVPAPDPTIGGDAPSGGAPSWPLWALLDASADSHSSAASGRASEATGHDLAEIIFTSGATADPKGVTLTHRNILANIVPVEREVLRYRAYGRPFSPIRFLNLLPMSHMFGQAMATFIPPMLSGVTVFMRGYNPSDIVRTIHDRKVSVLVCVPKMLAVLREHVERTIPEAAGASDSSPQLHVARRWWRYRRVHRLFGLKFWAFVVGAAPLDPELEAFWSRLGFLVVQGYGLTETAPIVTLNHPFRARRGTVGKPIAGVEVRIAPDGEILVRGDNVTSGYYNAPRETAATFEDGWLRTGDIGSIDASGRLHVQGRKKEMIVTPEGLNVFPEDVERVLLGIPGVRDAAVVGASHDGQERVHAVLIADEATDTGSIAREANRQLEAHQQIRGINIYPGSALPRTEGTQKLKRAAIRRWVEAGLSAAPLGSAPAAPNVLAIVQQAAGNRPVTTATTLLELGLSSIERVELLMALERAFDCSLDEAAVTEATDVASLEQLVAGRLQAAEHGVPPERQREPVDPFEFPRWNRLGAARLVRRLSLGAFLLPLTRLFAWIQVDGLEQLETAPDPVVYAANHQSHMDGPVILAALPPKRRYHLAIAASKEFFAAHFHPHQHTRRQRAVGHLLYVLASLLFNIFPLPQRESGARDAIRYLGELVSGGHSVLIFPEGRRTKSGEISPFQPGIGMIGSRLRVSVVPVRIKGLDRILHQSWRMARPGRAQVSFGAPMTLEGDDYAALAEQVEQAVKSL